MSTKTAQDTAVTMDSSFDKIQINLAACDPVACFIHLIPIIPKADSVPRTHVSSRFRVSQCAKSYNGSKGSIPCSSVLRAKRIEHPPLTHPLHVRKPRGEVFYSPGKQLFSRNTRSLGPISQRGVLTGPSLALSCGVGHPGFSACEPIEPR
jgi:hypothetical protein